MKPPTPEADKSLSPEPDVLSRTDVHLWLAAESSITSERLLDLSGILTAEERNRMERFRFRKDQQSFLLSRVHLRQTLSRYAAVHPSAWRFRATELGRPEIDQELRVPALHFSLSHTSGLVAVAVSRSSRVGVDAEDVRREMDLRAIADSALTERERERLHALGKDEYQRSFFELWTLKEAYVKALGVGMSLPPDRVEFAIEGDHIVLSKGAEEARWRDPETWRFRLYRPTPHHQVALACVREQVNERIRWATF